MTDYYCDITQGTFSDNLGTSTGTAYTGPAGLQAAIRGTGNATALAAGDRLYIKGTGDLSRLVLLDCNGTDVSGWGVGDVVHNKDAGSTWQGVVVETNSGAFLGAADLALVWLDSGYDESDILVAEGVTNDDAGGGAGDPTDVDPLAARSTPGFYVDNNSGAANNPIELIGVNSSWTDDGTRAILDGKDKAEYGLLTKAKNYIRPRNLHVKDTTSHGFHASSTTTNWHFENCWAEGCAGSGIYGLNFYYTTYHKCRAFDVTGPYGIYDRSGNATHCLAYNCVTGIACSGVGVANSAAYECTNGFMCFYGGALVGCVADKNANGIFLVNSATSQLVGCRITNNTTYGVKGDFTWDDFYCFYSGNGANFEYDLGNDLVDGESTRVTSGVVGYIDNDDATPNADRNYGLTNSAAARRQAVTL